MADYRNRITGILAALAVLACMASAQTKIGYVNSQEVLEKSVEGKKILARLQDSDQKNTAAVAKADAEIQTLTSRLNTQRLTLTAEAAATLTAELDRKTTERKRTAEDAYAAFTALRDRVLGTLQTELLAVVNQIGKEKGYDLILDLMKSGAIYWNPALDLTSEVIKRYDASKVPAK
jgi:outer membrane protein